MEGPRLHEQTVRVQVAVIHRIREHEAVWNFSQAIELRPAQPMLHVAEAVLVRHQLDKTLTAVGINQQNFFARNRCFQLPDLGKRLIGKRRTFYI
ncbi:hypothetical protein D3C75_525780 [compost metagenome]